MFLRRPIREELSARPIIRVFEFSALPALPFTLLWFGKFTGLAVLGSIAVSSSEQGRNAVRNHPGIAFRIPPDSLPNCPGFSLTHHIWTSAKSMTYCGHVGFGDEIKRFTNTEVEFMVDELDQTSSAQSGTEPARALERNLEILRSVRDRHPRGSITRVDSR
jgi:hypothetical protein